MAVQRLFVLCLAGALSSLALAQESLRLPAAPISGTPGTATPQPYAQPQASPIQRQGPGIAPLLPPPQGQTIRGMPPPVQKDQGIPLLEQQRNRQAPAEPGSKRQD